MTKLVKSHRSDFSNINSMSASIWLNFKALSSNTSTYPSMFLNFSFFLSLLLCVLKQRFFMWIMGKYREQFNPFWFSCFASRSSPGSFSITFSSILLYGSIRIRWFKLDCIVTYRRNSYPILRSIQTYEEFQQFFKQSTRSNITIGLWIRAPRAASRLKD